MIFRKRWTLFAVRRGDAMRFEPERPVLPVQVMKQRKCEAFGRLPERRAIFEKIGARNHDEFGSNEPNSIQAGILPQPVPDRQIDRLPLEVDRANARLHGNFNVRITLREHRVDNAAKSKHGKD